MARLKKGKFLGNEFELLDELQAKTEKAEEKAELLASTAKLNARQDDQTISATGIVGERDKAEEIAEDAVEEVLREAARSPRLGLILLAAKLERAAREKVKAVGSAGRESRTVRDLIQALVAANQFPPEGAEAFMLFSKVRNRIVHGYDAEDADVARAIDSGVQLLRMLIAIPKLPKKLP